MEYVYKKASLEELKQIWKKNIAANRGDKRWKVWKEEMIADNLANRAATFVVLLGNDPVGEGTLLFSPDCNAIRGRKILCDGRNTANINALRIEKAFEKQGHISKLVHQMEAYAAEHGYDYLTIGVEAKETRNLGIYLHWGYTEFVMSEEEDGALVLYYKKTLQHRISNHF